MPTINQAAGEIMNRYQVWVHDAYLAGHVFAENREQAIEEAREREGHADLSLCKIDAGYYQMIVAASAGGIDL